MDPRLLRYYNRELQHVREMGGEFAREYPKIAGRLGLEGFECADPYVERLLEGFAFLRHRRSPATIRYRCFSTSQTVIGWMMPFALIDCASSPIRSSSKFCRG